ncbi:amino acid adenylation domain-containing protein [Paenibacillus oenotherae]|uniref:Amino acid adenylation domain-containing protein n=2 Tax=Paenibacillus oenotherae TaxID=1435645 RepID=A0ABS7D9S9_9BACL|nr:non-ribosomal peptide synthetase [Paenibacillus oenotherae]MBW7476625.1 amino acid adenylation domain-containing protein [Paenibacillus oenotherae]
MVFVYDRETLNDRDYWSNKINAIEGTVFTPDFSAANPRKNSLSSIRLACSEELHFSIQKICKNSDYLLHAFIIAIVKVCVYKYTGQTSLVIGTPTYRSDQEGKSATILPVSTELRSEESFKTLVRNVRQTLIEAYEHDRFPLSQLMNTEEDPRWPDITVLVNTVHDREIRSPFEQNLLISVSPQDSGLEITVDYNSELYHQETVSLIAEHLIQLMTGAVSSELDIPVSNLTLLSESGRKQQENWNETDRPFMDGMTIHRLFENRAEQHPDRIAIRFEQQSLTYKQLNDKASRVAAELIRQGVGRNRVIAIAAKRSLEMMVGILGIMKAGGAYLPIDPSLPAERIQYMLQNSQTMVLLLQNEAICEAIPFDGNRIILDSSNTDADSEDSSVVLPENAPSDLAYVIYTSGSTGQPKGVMVEHVSLMNRLEWMQNEYRLLETDVILHKTPFVFDVSVWELFLWIIGGASVVMLQPEGEKLPDVIIREIEAKQVNIIHFVPSMFHAFLDYVDSLKDRSALASLKRIFTSGEALGLHHVQKFDERLGQPFGTRLINLYGPTEATIDVTYYDCTGGLTDRTVPIGKPIQNTKIHILDPDGHPQPVGVSGELCISGMGLARGYMNRTDLTAEKFIDRPVRLPDAERIYKTGDLAKWRSDGNIEYLGRIDQQVKIRGYRIELAEIEFVLQSHEAVKEAIVIKLSSDEATESLCAYYTSESEVHADMLRAHMANRIPEYMIPVYFVRLNQLPLTVSGKIDRKALPAPDNSKEDEYVAPSTALEEHLVSIWSSVLGKKRIGVTDNFFKLGGDSIKGIQVCARLNNIGYKLEMKTLFRYATIADVTPHIQQIDEQIDQGPVTGELPLLPMQEWFFEQQFVQMNHWNQAVMLYKESGYDENIVKGVFDGILEHHDGLRSVYFKDSEGSYRGQIKAVEQPLYTFETIAFIGLDGIELAQAIETEANRLQASIDLNEGPLVKLGLFKTDRGDHLLIAIHHLAVDGVSWRIIFEDFSGGYKLLEEGSPLQFPLKTHSVQEWGNSLREYATSAEFAGEATYWAEVERTVIDPLPRDYVLSKSRIADSAMVELQLGEEETELLLTQVNSAYFTEIGDILLAALGRAVQGWTGSSKIAVTMEGHGREPIITGININRTVGWFTSQYPVVLDIPYNSDLSYQIKKVKETLRAIPQKGAGYGIMRYLSGEGTAELGRLDPEISFNYLGQFDQDTEDTDIQMSPFPSGSTMNENSKRKAALDINGMVSGGRLSVSINYNGKEYEEATISLLASSFLKNLQDIIVHCVNRTEAECTPSDIFYSGVSLESLIDMQQKWSKEGRIQDIYPLTPLQNGMYFYSVYDQGSDAYFEQTCFDLDGDFDVTLFEKSLNKVVERHEVFRAVYDTETLDKPLQLIMQTRLYSIDYEDISEAEDQEAYMASVKKKDREKGFRIGNERLMRVTVLKRNDASHYVIWSFHHILMDGWCISRVADELFGIYDGYRSGQEPILQTAHSYRLFIEWLDRQNEENAKIYWQQYLEGLDERTELPYKKISSGFEKYDANESTLVLDTRLTEKLVRLAADQQVTMNIVIQTAWGLLLQNYNRSRDVVFGTVVSGRPPEVTGIEEMIGLFINTIPVRINVGEGVRFSEALKINQAAALSSAQYDFYPLYEIQANSSLRQQLFDHILIFENIPTEAAMESGNDRDEADGQKKLGIRNVAIFEQTNYDLNVIVVPGPQYSLQFKYNANLYSGIGIEQMKRHLLQIITFIADCVESPIQEIAIVGDEESNELIYRHNVTDVDYPREETVFTLFERQAASEPDRIAASNKDAHLTYRELNERANQLARLLKRKGCSRGHHVAVMAEHSFELLIGLLAVMKAGAAYIPIDPDHPAERVTAMLKESGASLFLMQSFMNAANIGAEIIYLDDQSIYEGESDNIASGCSGADLAYIMFTSGTTGLPKGSMITHQGLSNYIWWAKKVYVPDGGDFPLYSSIAFDLTVTSIFVPLISGRTVVIYNEPDKVMSIRRIVEDNKCDIIKLTPTHLSLLLDCNCNGSRVRRLIVGGENLSADLAGKIYKKFNGNIQIYNEYGPTETVVGCMIHLYDADAEQRASVPIGTPADNVSIYLLDEGLRPVPYLVPGEMYIGGDGVSNGYLNRAELTEEKFIANPYRPGERMYRTGDLARRQLDGTVEYLGRIDHQVKIRGYRIELGEIEAQLLKVEGVKEAAVLAWEEALEAYLCAYVVTEKELVAAELRAALIEKLPGYMVPSYFVHLERLPLTSNGKLDRKALPAPEGSDVARAAYEAPATELEKKLAELWQQVLGVERVGRQDHFFELGGHSLKATTLVAQLHKALHVNVPLRTVFQSPRLAELAEAIGGMEKTDYASIEPVANSDYYAVSSAQKRMYILNQLEEGQISYNMPSMYRVSGELDLVRAEEAFRRLITRHESLRTSFEIVDGEPVQRVQEGVELHLKVQEAADEEELQRQAESFVRPFDLAQAPLLRAEVVRVTSEDHLLLFDMHHIISDGLSTELMIGEWMRLYAGESLSELRIQYRDYAAWQRKLASSEAMRKQEAYWLETFAGELPVLELATDYARPAVQRFEGEAVGFGVEKETLEGLKRLAQETGATLYMVLLAAYTTLLHRYTGQEDIVVGTPIAGRPHADLEKLIGMFVGTLALRTSPSGEKTFREYVEEVKEKTLEAFENQDYPFEELVEKLDVRKDLSRNPLFDTMFVMQSRSGGETRQASGMEEAAAGEERLGFAPYGTGSTAAKFDLTLRATEETESLVLLFQYSIALFHNETIQKMADHFIELLKAVSIDPDVRMHKIELWNERELNSLMNDFNGTQRAYPGACTIHQLFEEQVMRTPNGIAVVDHEKRLTYSELNERANRLAHFLRGRGIRPGKVVALLMEPSIDLVSGMLAILKSGGTFLPLDPELPSERRAYMLELSNAELILTQRAYEVDENLLGKVVCMEQCPTSGLSDSTPSSEVGYEHNAYIIYTSGTTGQPKGVPIRHRSLINYSCWFAGQTGLTYNDKTVLVSSYSFDLGYTSLFPALISGCEVHLMRKERYMDPVYFWSYVGETELTYVKLAPSLFQNLVREPQHIRRCGNHCLRWIVLGGEPIKLEDIGRYRRFYAETRFMNHYGPTETTIGCIAHSIEPDDWQHFNSKPVIGRPIANTKALIVGSSNQLQPVGAVGELWIGGDGLSEGYLGDSELTKMRFVNSEIMFGKFYRTGDLGRYLSDGTIQLVGRKDDQVKIRGYRVELAEIEKQLLAAPGVRKAAVIPLNNENGELGLCAYVLLQDSGSIGLLRQHLQKRLPHYMIPSYLIELETFPLLANGKLDRKGLPMLDRSLVSQVSFVEPRNRLETELSEIWKKVLGITKVGVNDNFFELGGHSLKLMEVIHLVYERLGVELPFRTLYEHQSVESLAHVVRDNEYAKHASNYITKFNNNGRKNLFCFPPLVGYGVRYKQLAVHLDGTAVVYALDFIDEENPVAQYADLLIKTQPEGAMILFGYSIGGNLAFEVGQELEKRGRIVSDIIMLDSVKSVRKREEFDEHIEEEIAYFLGGADEEYADILESESVRNQVSHKMRSYILYRNDLINEGKVNAKLHCIVAEQPELEDEDSAINQWDDSSNAGYVQYEGSGSHQDMLQADHLKNNANIVNYILNKIIN